MLPNLPPLGKGRRKAAETTAVVAELPTFIALLRYLSCLQHLSKPEATVQAIVRAAIYAETACHSHISKHTSQGL